MKITINTPLEGEELPVLGCSLNNPTIDMSQEPPLCKSFKSKGGNASRTAHLTQIVRPKRLCTQGGCTHHK